MKITELRLNDIGKKALFFFVFFVPIFYFTNMNFGNATLRIGQEQAFQIGAVILYALVLLENIYLALFLLLSVATYLGHNFSGGNYLVNIVYGCIIYQVSYQIIDSKTISQAFKVVLWLVFLNIIWLILQNTGNELLFVEVSTQKLGNMNNVAMMGLKAMMGMFFALSIPIMAFFNPMIALLFFIPIWLSESSISIIAGVASLGFFIFLRLSRRWKTVVAILSMIAIFYTFQDSKANMMADRFDIWKITLRDAMQKPISGWGLDAFRNINLKEKTFNYFKNVPTNKSGHGIYIQETKQFLLPDDCKGSSGPIDPWDHPHNEYVSLFFEYGVLGVIIFLLLSRDMMRRFNRSDDALVCLAGFFISLLIISVAQFPFHLARIGVFIPVFLGAYYRITDDSIKLEQITKGVIYGE